MEFWCRIRESKSFLSESDRAEFDVRPGQPPDSACLTISYVIYSKLKKIKEKLNLMPISDNAKMVHHLEYDQKHIILVGTAHVSKESAEQVTRMIQEESPDTVCVELCQSRYQSIRHRPRESFPIVLPCWSYKAPPFCFLSLRQHF